MLDRWNELVPLIQQQKLDDLQLADVIENELLPPWRVALDKFEKADVGDAQLQSRGVEYLRTRKVAWEQMVEGLRTHDDAIIERAGKPFQDSDALVQKLNQQQP